MILKASQADAKTILISRRIVKERYDLRVHKMRSTRNIWVIFDFAFSSIKFLSRRYKHHSEEMVTKSLQTIDVFLRK